MVARGSDELSRGIGAGIQESAATERGGLAEAVQVRPAVEPSQEWQALLAQRTQIQGWLNREPPLRLVRTVH